MNHNIETELKTIISKQQFEKLCSFYPELKFVTQHNYYFNTTEGASYAFRIRVKEDKQLFTLKHYVNGEIMEYEKEFRGKFEDDPDIIETLNQFEVKPPYHIFGDLITQRAMYINDLAELCFDINTYNGITDYEIEYEIKKDHDYHEAFKEILKKADIEYVPSYASKYKRCMLTLPQNSSN